MFHSTGCTIAGTYQRPIKPEEHQEVNFSPPGLRGSQQSRMQADWRQSQPTAPDRNSYWLHFSCSLLQYNATFHFSSTLCTEDPVPFAVSQTAVWPDYWRYKCALLKQLSVTWRWTPVPFKLFPLKTRT